MESSVFLIMSVNSFIAIHNPLRYSSILTTARVIKISLIFAALCLLFAFSFPFILKRLRFYRKSLLSHSYCFHQDVKKLAHSDIQINIIYGLFVVLKAVLDLVGISVSYILILKFVLGMTSHKSLPKVLNTCIFYICAVLIFCVPIITLAALHCFAKMFLQLLGSS